MARNRAKKRNKHSERPSSASSIPPAAARAPRAKEGKGEAEVATRSARPPGTAAPATTTGSAHQKPNEQADHPQGKPRNLHEQQAGAQPAPHEAQQPQDRAADENRVEAKNKLAHDDRKSGPGDDGSQDDALHDEFFRQGERVDKEHIAAREAAVNAQPPEAMARPHPAAKRQDPRLAERRRNLRRVVGYVLAPAIVIALIAGAKVLNSTSEASPRPASPPPPALSDTHPSTAASSQHAASDTTAPAPHAPMAADSTAALTDTDSAPVAPAAASNEEAAPATQNVNAAAPPAAAYAADAPAFPDGVDPRKAASLALNRGKWNEALTAARAALAKEPTDATLYLYEGTALQEQGRKQEAKEVFRRCVDNAKKGPVNECRVFAR